jgi:hypothetical protein
MKAILSWLNVNMLPPRKETCTLKADELRATFKKQPAVPQPRHPSDAKAFRLRNNAVSLDSSRGDIEGMFYSLF